MGWVSDWPLSGTPVSGSPDQTQDNFEIIDDWWGVEHFTFTSGTSGEHTPGKVAALYYGSQAEINALTSPGCGSLAYATDKGVLELYRDSWESITANKFSRVCNVASTLTIPPCAETAITTWGSTAASGMYDTLEEWTSNRFNAKAAGYYLVTVQASWAFVAAADPFNKAIGLYKNASLYAVSKRNGSSVVYNAFCAIVPLNAGEYIRFTAWHNAAGNKTLNQTIIYIQRIS